MTTSLKMPPEKIRALRAELEDRGFTFKPLPYGHYQARGEEVVVAAYKSGKVVVQGKGEQAFLERAGLTVPAATMPTQTCVGSDESGKGDYFGPLVVAAVRVEPGQIAMLQRAGVKDCKKLSDSATMRAAVAVRESCSHFVRAMMPPEYNERHAAEGNVALFLSAMHAEAAREALGDSDGTERIVIDQFTFPERLKAALENEGLHNLDVEIRHRAEDNPAVAAASVLARAEFLIALKELGHDQGLELPKGAGSNVDRVARQIFEGGGLEALDAVAKTHFRTTEKVTGLF
ncbi:MAG: ribonuclease HIII [Planctomycetota bacterium]